MGLLDRLRPQPAWKDADPGVRRAAVRDLTDITLLNDLGRTDPDEAVRREAAAVLIDLALHAGAEADALAALATVDDTHALLIVARSSAHEATARAALQRLTDPRAFGSVARSGEHAAVRLAALQRVEEVDELTAVAQRTAHADTALAALARISDTTHLEAVAHKARCRAASRRARAMLRQGAEEPEAAGGRGSDEERAAQVRLCGTVEALAGSPECEPLAARLLEARDAWADLPAVDDDLDERFTAACREARRRLTRNQAEREERRRRDRERARYIEPRLALVRAVEAAPAAEARHTLGEARVEWDRLEFHDSDEARTLAERLNVAVEAAEARAAGHERLEEKARQRVEKAADREEREANEARLATLCDGLERLIAAESISLKKARQAMQKVREALDPTPPLPPKGQRALIKRLKAIQAALSPRVQDLREKDEWKRWANAGVQEELCTRAEALVEMEDVLRAERLLRDLRERWKTAAAAPQDRAQELWQRFKAAQEAIHARRAAHNARLEEERAAQHQRKEALCVQVEALAESSDWSATAETIKGLQAEWKTIGPAPRGKEKAIWKRFRAACDQFFTRRNEALDRRRAEWAANLERKEAVCVRAEALAGSTEWEAGSAALRALQVEWKAIGAVGRKRSDAVWKRFREACDRFFERYRRREAIDREALLDRREAICAGIEARLAAPTAAPVGETEAAPAAGDLLETLRVLRTRWQEGGAVPGERSAALETRFQQAIDRLIAAHPEAVRGTELDPDANRTRLEELCERVEKQLQVEPEVPAGMSPAAQLAARLKEALASNTIGGAAAGTARWRAAAEEVRKAQAAWQRLASQPVEGRGPLTERFENTCRRFFERCPAAATAPASASYEERSGPRDRGGRSRDRGPGRDSRGGRPRGDGSRPRGDGSRSQGQGAKPQGEGQAARPRGDRG